MKSHNILLAVWLLASVCSLKACFYTNEVINSLLSGRIYGIGYNPNGSCIAISYAFSDAGDRVNIYRTSQEGCAFLDNPTIITGPITPFRPSGVAFSAQGSHLAIADYDAGQVYIYPTTNDCSVAAAPILTISGLTNPRGIAFSPDGTLLAVTNFGSTTVNIYTLSADYTQANLTQTITGLASPCGVAFSSNGSCLAVANFNTGIDGFLSLYAQEAVSGNFVSLQTLAGFNSCYSVAYTADGSCLAVADFTASKISIYTTNADCTIHAQPSAVITVAFNPRPVAFAPGDCLAVGTDIQGLQVYQGSSATALAIGILQKYCFI